MKILNLYSGLGGNRKHWDEVLIKNGITDYEIIAVEHDSKIAKIYQDFFPNDKVIVADAHQYLLDHFREFDFIWSSPPCPSHSRIRNEGGVGRGQNKPIYPEMSLYQEIIFLQHMFKLKNSGFKGKYVVENVISYYEPLIKPNKIAEHYFWANFIIKDFKNKSRNHFSGKESLQKSKEFDLSQYNGIDKIKLLRNCTESELGKHIFNLAINPITLNLSIFQ